MWIYKYQQLDGNAAFTIYGGEGAYSAETCRRGMAQRAAIGLPVRVTLNSEYVEDNVRAFVTSRRWSTR